MQLAKSQFVIPSFTTYYYVLKGYFEHKLDLFYCAKCGVLQFYYVDDSTNFPIKFDCILCGGELLSCEKQLDRSICQDQVNLQ